MFRVLDLFSGIGGFSLGLERAGGFKTVAFCEIEPFCQKVLKKHWPEVPIYTDVTKMEFCEGMADVITGGFPCQDISYAGKGAGLAGERSGLFRELLRAVRMVRPRHVIVENVAALLDRGMGVVLGEMACLGHDAEWDCISAADVGAPHGRERVWITTTDANGQQQTGGGSESIRRRKWCAEETAQAASDANSLRQLQPGRIIAHVRRWIADGFARTVWAGDWQAKFEALCRMDDGLPTRLDRSRDEAAVKSLGNAVIPQIPELIGRAIMQAEGMTPAPQSVPSISHHQERA